MAKKIPDGAQREEAAIRKQLEQNRWNPFERVDPKILEMLHRKHGKEKKQVLLTQTEDAPV